MESKCIPMASSRLPEHASKRLLAISTEAPVKFTNSSTLLSAIFQRACLACAVDTPIGHVVKVY